MRIKWVIDKIEEKEGQFCRINNVFVFFFFTCTFAIMVTYYSCSIKKECMWLKRLSAHPDLPVLYSGLDFSTLWMLLTARKGLHVDIGEFHVYITM